MPAHTPQVKGVFRGVLFLVVRTTTEIPDEWRSGTYTLRFDMYINTDGPLERFRDSGWPTYDVPVRVIGRTGTVYLPLTQHGTAVTEQHTP